MTELLSPEKYPEYEAFVSAHPNGGFTQSVNWTKVKNNWDHAVVVSRDEAGAIRGGMLVLLMKMPVVGASMMYAPRGPVCDYRNRDVLKELLEGALQLAKERNGYIFKIDPCVLADDQETIDLLTGLGFRFTPGAKHHETIQTRHNYQIAFPQGPRDTEQLFMTIGRKSRYCVRYALKAGVECRVCDETALDDFYKIYSATGQRDSFSVRPKEYLARFLQAFGTNVRLYVTYYEGEPVSGGITTQFAGKTCHVYGASSDEHRDLNANYLMQWEMIKWAYESGCSLYDFQGVTIDPEEDPHLYGVYQFKKSFKNGALVEYAGEFDYIINPAMHSLVQAAQKVKEKASGLKKNRKG